MRARLLKNVNQIRGALRCFRNSGQSCNAPTRMLVEKSMYEEDQRKHQKYQQMIKFLFGK